MRILYKETKYVLNCLREMYRNEPKKNFDELDHELFYDKVQSAYIGDKFKWNLEDWVVDLRTYNEES